MHKSLALACMLLLASFALKPSVASAEDLPMVCKVMASHAAFAEKLAAELVSFEHKDMESLVQNLMLSDPEFMALPAPLQLYLAEVMFDASRSVLAEGMSSGEVTERCVYEWEAAQRRIEQSMPGCLLGARLVAIVAEKIEDSVEADKAVGLVLKPLAARLAKDDAAAWVAINSVKIGNSIADEIVLEPLRMEAGEAMDRWVSGLAGLAMLGSDPEELFRGCLLARKVQ